MTSGYEHRSKSRQKIHQVRLHFETIWLHLQAKRARWNRWNAVSLPATPHRPFPSIISHIHLAKRPEKAFFWCSYWCQNVIQFWYCRNSSSHWFQLNNSNSFFFLVLCILSELLRAVASRFHRNLICLINPAVFMCKESWLVMESNAIFGPVEKTACWMLAKLQGWNLSDLAVEQGKAKKTLTGPRNFDVRLVIRCSGCNEK